MDGRMHNYILISFLGDLGRSSVWLSALHVMETEAWLPSGTLGTSIRDVQTTKSVSCLYGNMDFYI